MRVKVHRGLNQIGGSVIEIASETTKILLDAGLELNGELDDQFELEGLFDHKGYDAVFLSHYHSDHIGLAYRIHKDIPLYMGEMSFKVIEASDRYKGIETLVIEGFIHHKRPINIGNMVITPFLCDHSAFDSYMILVECEGEKILYTGDFRANGRKPFAWLLEQLPTKIDILICEGTSLSRINDRNETEQELEERAVDLFTQTKGPIFVLQSSMNIDRLVTIYRAAKRSERIMLQDLYLAEISSSIGGSIPNPKSFADVQVFLTRPYSEEHYRYAMFQTYGAKRISKEKLSKTKFVMCIRASMKEYINSLSNKMTLTGGLLIYSFWSGYQEQEDMNTFLTRCEALGLRTISMHTSGHADQETIRELIEHTKPGRIIPVHTENAAWFDEFDSLPHC